jgi:hypothetical protein
MSSVKCSAVEVFEKSSAIIAQSALPDRHSFFQLKKFIIEKEPTIQGQLWQIVRELTSRKETIESLELQIGNVEDSLELLNIRSRRLDKKIIGDDQDEALEKQILQRQIQREIIATENNLKTLKGKIRYVLEEVSYLVDAFEKISAVEPMKPIDDLEAQRQYWNEKFSTELNLRLLMKHHIDCELVKTIMSLDEDAPVKQQMTGILKKVQEYQIAERDRQLQLEADLKSQPQKKRG